MSPCSSVAVALGGLTLWHTMLITRGETSVERHINRKETKRLKEKGKVFRNPYHHGRINNWKLLFGVEKRSHWLTRVLLPSSHPPKGDGIMWDCTFTRRDPMAIWASLTYHRLVMQRLSTLHPQQRLQIFSIDHELLHHIQNHPLVILKWKPFIQCQILGRNKCWHLFYKMLLGCITLHQHYS